MGLYPNIMVPVAEVVLAVPVEKRRRKRHTTNCEECASNDGADIGLLICTKGCCRLCCHWCRHHGCCSSHFSQPCRSVPGCCCCCLPPPPPLPLPVLLLLLKLLQILPSMFIDKA